MFLSLQVGVNLRLSFEFGEDAADSGPLPTCDGSCRKPAVCAGHLGEVGCPCRRRLESPSVGDTAVLRTAGFVESVLPPRALLGFVCFLLAANLSHSNLFTECLQCTKP